MYIRSQNIQRERERERGREGEGMRETDRQTETDIETERQRDRDTERQTDRRTYIQLAKGGNHCAEFDGRLVSRSAFYTSTIVTT